MMSGFSTAVIRLGVGLVCALWAAGTVSAEEAPASRDAGQPTAPVEREAPAQVPPKATHYARPAQGRMDPLERRLKLLTRELDLNSDQQKAVREILQGQRAAVLQIWSDPAIAPAERAPAVRLVGERTADRIRAVLSEEQKKKYNRPLPDGALSAQASTDVAGWLKTVRGQTSENPLGVALPTSQAVQSDAP